jgi:flagellin
MSMTINTNVASLNGQRNLATSQNKLSNSLQRLSSGLRINSAKDDAAGLAISNRMSSQIRGMNQAARNANDGISLAQTAEGALQESTQILQRIRELAVQSANDTNTASDRTSMQAEVEQLTEELQRIAETTQFNGKNLLDGTLVDATFQVGANAGANQTLSFGINSAQTADLSAVGTTISGGTTATGTSVDGNALAADAISVNGTNVAASASGSASDIAAAINAAVNGGDSANNIATAQNVQAFEFADVTLAAAAATATGTAMTGPTAGGGDLTIGGENVALSTSAAALATNIETAATAADLTVTATAVDATSGTQLNTWVDVTASVATQVVGTEVTGALTAANDLIINGTDVGIVADVAAGNLAEDIASAIETAADTAAGGVSDITVTVGASAAALRTLLYMVPHSVL